MIRTDALDNAFPACEPTLDARTDALWTASRDRVWAAVLADCKQVDAEEKAAKLTPHQMLNRLQVLFDAADGECVDIMQDAYEAMERRCKEIEQREKEQMDAYESEALRQSSGARKI